jgi:hypothetical protein
MVIFYGEELLAPRPTPKLEDHPLSAVHDCIFAATLHIRRTFLHPQPKGAPCRGVRDPLIMDKAFTLKKKLKIWDDENKLIVQQKNLSYKKYLQTKTIHNEIEYKRRRAIAKR